MKIEYYINEEQRVVVAYASYTQWIAESKIFSNDLVFANATVKTSCELPWKIKAVARCRRDDTFDVEQGKRIAKAKLLAKISHLTKKAAKRVVKYKLKEINYLNDIIKNEKQKSDQLLASVGINYSYDDKWSKK